MYKSNFQIKPFYIIAYIALFIIIFILLFLIQSHIWPLLISFILLFPLFGILTSKLTQIQVDNIKGILTLYESNYIRRKKGRSYDLTKVEFTYSRKIIATTAKPENVCVIYYQGDKICTLIPNVEKWQDSEISRFVYDIRNLGVREKLPPNDLSEFANELSKFEV